MSRRYETEIEIAGSAEAVWKALSEAEGIQSWFAPEARVTPGVGGEIWVSWGPGMEGASRIEIWEPARHQRYGHDAPGGGEPKMVDFTIEARDGGHTVLRLVNSGFGADASFDNELESSSHAWPLFLLLLKHSVEYPHQTCRNLTIFQTVDLPREQAWERLQTSLKIDGQVCHLDPFGNICYELAAPNGAVLAIFCEKCGGTTALTVTCLLYDASPEDEAAANQLIKSISSKIL